MKFSKFSNFYEIIYKDICYYILRHSITNRSLFLTEKEFNELMGNLKNKRETNSISILKKEHILVPDNYSEIKFANYLKEKYNLNKFDLEIIYLIFNAHIILSSF